MDTLPDDETSLGLKIAADVESINNTSHEFLVNFDYLVKLIIVKQLLISFIPSLLYNKLGYLLFLV
jgi:hypothetical protein